MLTATTVDVSIITDGNANEGQESNLATCTAAVDRLHGDVELHVLYPGSSEYVLFNGEVATTLGPTNEYCTRNITKHYKFVPRTQDNGMNIKCIATNSEIPDNVLETTNKTIHVTNAGQYLSEPYNVVEVITIWTYKYRNSTFITLILNVTKLLLNKFKICIFAFSNYLNFFVTAVSFDDYDHLIEVKGQSLTSICTTSNLVWDTIHIYKIDGANLTMLASATRSSGTTSSYDSNIIGVAITSGNERVSLEFSFNEIRCEDTGAYRCDINSSSNIVASSEMMNIDVWRKYNVHAYYSYCPLRN